MKTFYEHHGFDSFDAYDMLEGEQMPTRCNRCRSTDVRWRQQGGKWVLFSLTPGQLHTCEIDASEFGAVPE